MNELQIFNSEEFGVIRVVDIDSEPWFVAKDVSDVLEYRDSYDMLKILDEDEKIHLSREEASNRIKCGTEINNRGINLINESGLYSAILKSRKPEAKRFKKWVTKEVLPSIRQTGGYIPHNDEDDDATIMAKALLISQKTIEKKNNKIKSLEKETLKLVEVIESQKPKLEYLDEILSSENAMTVTQIAFDYDLSAKALNKILNEERVQRNVRGQWILYSNYQGKGYTKTETENYGGKPRTLTVWTQKGRMLIHEILNKRQIKALMDLELSEV
ncbi:MAG: BRO family protein [Romboutsia sp.]